MLKVKPSQGGEQHLRATNMNCYPASSLVPSDSRTRNLVKFGSCRVQWMNQVPLLFQR